MGLWWVEEPRVLASSHPDESLLLELKRQGFRHVFSFLEPQEQAANYDVSRLRPLGFSFYNLAVKDYTAPCQRQLEHFVDLMRGLTQEKVLLHCQGGKGRTGTFAAVYLIAFQAYLTQDAISRVRLLQSGAIETLEQEQAIFKFAERSQDSPSI